MPCRDREWQVLGESQKLVLEITVQTEDIGSELRRLWEGSGPQLDCIALFGSGKELEASPGEVERQAELR